MTTTTATKPKLRPLALFLLTLLGAGSIALGFRGKSHERYDEEKARHDRECAAWLARGGASEACETNVAVGSRPKLVPMYTETREQIRMARAAIALGMESNVGIPTLGAALDTAVKLDRHGTPLSEMMAAALVDQVLDAIEGKPEKNPSTNDKLAELPINTTPVASTSALRRLLSTPRELRAARRPLEGERLYTLTSMRAMREQAASSAPALLRGSFASATAADLMHDYSAVTRSMEAAILRGDEAQCHAAATGYATSSSVSPASRFVVARFGLPHQVLCGRLIEVVKTAKRFEKVRRERLALAS